MKFLKIFGIIVLVLIILIIAAAFILPTQHHIESTKVINAPPTMVYNTLNDLKAHTAWTPLKDLDETITFELGEKTVGKGATYSWRGDNTLNGTYTIVNSTLNESINSRVDYDNGGGADGAFHISNEDGKTKVTWSYDVVSKRFSNLTMPFSLNKLKKQFDAGLENIDQLISKRQGGEYYGYKVKPFMFVGQHYVARRQLVNKKVSQQFYVSNLGYLFTKLQEAEIPMVGGPCGFVYNWKDGKMDMAAAVPVEDNITVEGAMSETILPGQALVVDYYGDYENLDNVHTAMQTYLSDRNQAHNWPIIIEYVTERGLETNSEEWLTKVIYTIGVQ